MCLERRVKLPSYRQDPVTLRDRKVREDWYDEFEFTWPIYEWEIVSPDVAPVPPMNQWLSDECFAWRGWRDGRWRAALDRLLPPALAYRRALRGEAGAVQQVNAKFED